MAYFPSPKKKPKEVGFILWFEDGKTFELEQLPKNHITQHHVGVEAIDNTQEYVGNKLGVFIELNSMDKAL